MVRGIQFLDGSCRFFSLICIHGKQKKEKVVDKVQEKYQLQKTPRIFTETVLQIWTKQNSAPQPPLKFWPTFCNLFLYIHIYVYI